MKTNKFRGSTAICLWLCGLFLVLAQPVFAQTNSTDVFSDSMALMIDDNTPGMVRVGDIQILYGRFHVPCGYPAQLCSVSVRFVAPFLEKPVVTLTSLSNSGTNKNSFATLVQDHLTTSSFVARVQLQANIQSLRNIPWMAIGRWR